MRWLITFWLCIGPLVSLGQTYEERAVAAVLMGEAWSEGVRGMTAAADVICQRAKEKDWTPLRVVAAHRGRVHAFSCLNGTTLDRLIRKFEGKPDYQDALQIAHKACQTPDRLPDITNSANHYTRKTEHPYWAKGKRPVAVIGRHAFYKLKHF
jgi:cell wall hydrolase